MISAVVIAKNEEKNISRCLKSLDWCDETVVVDDFSQDQTLKATENYPVKVFQRKLEGNFSDQRNYGLLKSNGDWVLFVDADEEVPNNLKKEILEAIGKANLHKRINGFYLKRKDLFIGKWLGHGETGAVRLLRLARRGSGEWQRKVDEVWKINGQTKNLEAPLLHYSHQSVKEFLQSINSYSSLNSRQLYEENKKVRLLDWFKPLFKFLHNYFFRLGFLDGIQGFLLAVLMSFHSFLVRGKLYLIWKKEGGWR